MTTSHAKSANGTSSARLKVFLSYSREDSAFVQELLEGLELLGFDAYLDKHDIAPGEPWEERLRALIQLADTIVFIISTSSVKSPYWAWELKETEQVGKRMVPVLLTSVPDEAVPEQLRSLNYVLFNEGRSFAKALGDLARALRANAGWIREHTRYADIANRWVEREKPASLLLRGDDLEEARAWLVARPADVPEVSANQQAFIEASSASAAKELAAKAKLRGRIQVGLLGTVVVLTCLTGFSIWQWKEAVATKSILDQTNQELRSNRTQLENTIRDLVANRATLERTVKDLNEARGTLERTVQDLHMANARLERKLALRVSPRGYDPYDIPAGWFQIATRYAGAVAFVEGGRQVGISGSGVLINAKILNPAWKQGVVFVTGIYVVSEHETAFPSAIQAGEGQLVMFGPRSERRTAPLGRVLWQSKTLGISVSAVGGQLPPDVTPIVTISKNPEALAGLQTMVSEEVNALFDEKAILKDDRNFRPIVSVGNIGGRPEMLISISHLLAISSNNQQSPSAVSGGVTRELSLRTPKDNPSPAGSGMRPDLLYRHATLPGGGGSPIFDAATGELIGIHLMALPCSSDTNKRCAAAGTSLRRILSAIRAS